jgi:transcriptional regulator with XRE-family HTH domain
MSQQTLGDAVGVSAQAISDLERGVTQATAYLAEVARALGSTAEYLRYGDEIRETQPHYRADLDRITEMITTGQIDAKSVKALRQIAETLAN